MPEQFKEGGVWNPGISDHSMVYGLMMEKVGYHKSKLLSFRNRKNINETKLLKDLHLAPWHVGSIFDSIDDQYSYWTTLLNSILDDHAPLKKMRVRAKDVPYITLEWKRAIRRKCRFAKIYTHNPTAENLLLKNKWRNEATKQRRKAIKEYWKAKSEAENKSERILLGL